MKAEQPITPIDLAEELYKDSFVEIDKEDYYELERMGYSYPSISIRWTETYPTYWCDTDIWDYYCKSIDAPTPGNL